jgi:hypothetical protein
MMVAAKPANVIDLGWKIAGLATIDRTRYRAEIQALVADLYRWQREDGRLPYAFDANAPASDFITIQALYALAVAGQRPETDARVATMIAYTLRAQRPEGGWQGNAVYKGFDTPFRDTQFAVMALSELFPSHEAKSSQKTDLELLGEKRSASVVLLQSESVLAREAAARECRDSGALAKALGDRSKLVQRAAAESLRKLGQGAAADIASALQSTDSRTRWGALRVFDKHFRDLSGNEKLLTAVVSQLSDSAPENRFAAAKALWQWYSWQSDSPGRRMKILNALAGRTGAEPDALVRRGLTESIYNVLDENVGQLAAWQRAMADDKDRGRTQQALQAVVREQSAIMARHIREGNRDARISLLTALWDFHVRHMAIPDESRGKVDVILPAFFSQFASGVAGLGEKGFEYAPYREAASFRYDAVNGFQQVRLGNDGDLIRLFGDSGTELEQALLACLQAGDREMTLQVIKAGSVLGEAVTPKFTGAMLGLLDGEDAEIRAAVRYVYEKNARGRLSLGEQKDLAPLLEKLLVPERPDGLAVALPLVAELPLTHPLVHDWKIIAKVEALARQSSVPVYAEVLRATAAIPRLADGPLMRAQLLEALQSGDERAGVVAMRLVVGRYVTDATVSALAEQFLHATRGRLQAMLLDELDPSKYALRVTAANSYNGGGALGKLPVDNNLFSSPQVVEFVSQSLTSPTRMVREAARDLVREHPDLAVKAGLQVHETRPQPDFEFFTKRVEPILSRVASDGKACAMCHASHALFKLTPGRTRDNYLNALKVVDQAEPRKSLILVKPTRPNDSAGDPNLYLATHNGGERWAGNEMSAEYQTILEWIRGARLAPANLAAAVNAARTGK